MIASSSSLKSEYLNNNFDYDFPEGFSNLLARNSLIALMPNGGDTLVVELLFDQPLKTILFDRIFHQYLLLEEEDEILFMTHADFTMICSRKNGDYQKYGWPLNKVLPLKSGQYKLEIGIVDVTEKYDEYKASYLLKINITPSNVQLSSNEILTIPE